MTDKSDGVHDDSSKLPTPSDRDVKPPTDTAPSKRATGGIFGGGLDTYRTVTDEDYQALLKSGLVVLDANVLLNFYRYHTATRENLIQALTRIGERLWVPYQAMFEFWERRLSVIASRSKEAEDIVTGLNKSSSGLESGIRQWANRVGLSSDETAKIVGVVRSAVEDVTRKIRETSTDDSFKEAEDTTKDPVVSALDSILKSNVGAPLSAKESQEAKVEAKRRIIENRAPGWKDAKKENPEGDYIIWLQTLQEAKRRGLDVVFITGDVKDDWWRKDHGEAKGPLAELVYEMRLVADVRLFMLRPGSLLFHADKAFDLNVDQKSIQDAQRVSSAVSIGWNVEELDWPEMALEILFLLDDVPDKSTYKPLEESLTRLVESSPQSPDDRLGLVWNVVDQAIATGLMGPVDGTSFDELTSRLRGALDALHLSAVETWLLGFANKIISLESRAPSNFVYYGSRPPLVTDIHMRVSQRGEFDEVEFVADTTNNGEVSVSRFVKGDKNRTRSTDQIG